MPSNSFVWNSSAAVTASFKWAISSPMPLTFASCSALDSFFDRSIPDLFAELISLGV